MRLPRILLIKTLRHDVISKEEYNIGNVPCIRKLPGSDIINTIF